MSAPKRIPVSLSNHKLKLAILMIVVLAVCTEVEAGYTLSSVAVSAIVRNACTADTDVAINGKAVTATASVSAAGEIAVDCSIGTPYAVAFNTGTIRGASSAEESVINAPGTLPYGLYGDGAFKVKWGTGAGPETVSGTYREEQAPVPVYGKLIAKPANQNDAKTDLLTVTVNY